MDARTVAVKNRTKIGIEDSFDQIYEKLEFWRGLNIRNRQIAIEFQIQKKKQHYLIFELYFKRGVKQFWERQFCGFCVFNEGRKSFGKKVRRSTEHNLSWQMTQESLVERTSFSLGTQVAVVLEMSSSWNFLARASPSWGTSIFELKPSWQYWQYVCKK